MAQHERITLTYNSLSCFVSISDMLSLRRENWSEAKGSR